MIAVPTQRIVTVMNAARPKVVVTGAGGRTGGLVIKKLLERSSDFDAAGIVRSDKSSKQLKGYGATDEQIFIGDILSDNGAAVLEKALNGADCLVIATSAVPKIKPLSLVPVLLAKLFKKEGVRPKFTFKEGQMPEQIDWEGQRLQIDLAKKAGVTKVVLVGSMGGTDRSNFLNTIGDGDILVWKRRAEVYLINSGLKYTIIHPGGLKDDEGGKREIVLDINDNLISSKSKYRSIPRADVAELCIAAITTADNRAVDAVAKDPSDGAPTTDFVALFDSLKGDCDYSDMKDDAVLAAIKPTVSV